MKTPQEKLQAVDWFIANLQSNYTKNLQNLQLYDIDVTPLTYHNYKLDQELNYLRNNLINEINKQSKTNK